MIPHGDATLFSFIQTPIFSELLDECGESDLLSVIESELANNPDGGSLIRGGMRKIRIASAKRASGKRGGYRVWYFFEKPTDTFYLLFLLDKKEADSLTRAQEKLLIHELKRQLRIKI